MNGVFVNAKANRHTVHGAYTESLIRPTHRFYHPQTVSAKIGTASQLSGGAAGAARLGLPDAASSISRPE